ncbi:MAG: FxsA family protein [Spirochaetales bacterium]|nr:FxsA family protein [Spirochaetales bacterium]
MIQTSIFISLLKKETLAKILLLFLLYTLIPLIEIFLLMYLGDFFGVYFMLGLAAATGFFGVLIALFELNKTISVLKRKIKDGIYPDKEFINLAGVLIGGLLLISPGLITDSLGFLMFIPPIRMAIGKIITKRMDKTFKEIYEYLKLYEMQ